MRFVFWQNCLSPHQLPYIVHLMDDEKVDEVIIVSDCAVEERRKQMGWNVLNIPLMEQCQIILQPTAALVDKLLQERTKDSIHLFSGIRAFRFIYDVFRQSLKYPLRRGLITERPNTYAKGCSNGKPLWLHKLRFYLQDYQYIPFIDCIFAIGEECVNYYQSLSKQWKVFPFCYCTYNPIPNHKTVSYHLIKFIFIGRLIKLKGVLTLLQAINNITTSEDYELTIVGDGPETSRLHQYIHDNQVEHVRFLGTISNEQIPSLLQEHDILILPSIYDGWGAVVNEALMQGKYVICSNQCGAKALLKNPMNGSIFKGGNYKELANQMQYCINNISIIRNQDAQRKKWANECISGKAIAKYMIDCLNGKPTKTPWIE